MLWEERKHSCRIEYFRQVRNMKVDFVGAVSDRLSIPEETIADVPLIELRGRRSISVENHRGIAEYSPERIQIHLKRGSISVGGDDLRIVCMNRKRLEIRGGIRCVELE